MRREFRTQAMSSMVSSGQILLHIWQKVPSNCDYICKPKGCSIYYDGVPLRGSLGKLVPVGDHEVVKRSHGRKEISQNEKIKVKIDGGNQRCGDDRV